MRKKSALCLGWLLLGASFVWAEGPVDSAKKADSGRGPVAVLRRSWGSVTGVVDAVVDTVGGVFGKGGKAGSEKPKDLKIEVSLELETPSVALSKDRQVRGVMRLVNKGRRTQALHFASSQRVEAVLRGESGEIVARANEDREVREEEGVLAINPGERLEFEVGVPTRELAAGRVYRLEAAVVNQPGLVARKEIRVQP